MKNFYYFCTKQGHCGACRRKWRLTDTDLCPCGETQTVFHINIETSYFTYTLLQLICWRDRQEVRSEDQETQERSGLFHSCTEPSFQGKGEQCNSQVSHHRPCRGREPCHRLGQSKTGRQRDTAMDQMDKRGTLNQEDTDTHESGCRILPTQPHMGPVDFQVTCSIEL